MLSIGDGGPVRSNPVGTIHNPPIRHPAALTRHEERRETPKTTPLFFYAPFLFFHHDLFKTFQTRAKKENGNPRLSGRLTRGVYMGAGGSGVTSLPCGCSGAASLLLSLPWHPCVPHSVQLKFRTPQPQLHTKKEVFQSSLVHFLRRPPLPALFGTPIRVHRARSHLVPL